MSEYLSKEEIRKWRSSLERITLEEYAARLGKIIQEEKHDDSLVDNVMLRSLNSMSMERYKPKAEKIQSLSIKSFAKERNLKAKQDLKNELKQEIKDIKEINTEIKKELKQEINPSNITKISEEKCQSKYNDKECDLIADTLKNEQSYEANEAVINSNTKIDGEICNSYKVEEIEESQDYKNTTKTEVLVQKEIKKELNPIEKEAINNIEETVNYSFSKALTSREQLVFDHFLANKNTIVYAKDLAKILELPRDYVYKYIKNLRGKLNENILHNADNGGYMLKV